MKRGSRTHLKSLLAEQDEEDRARCSDYQPRSINSSS